MTSVHVQPSKRPTPPAQDCRCTRCGNINRQTYPGQPCVWASGDPAELQADPGANCGGTLVSIPVRTVSTLRQRLFHVYVIQNLKATAVDELIPEDFVEDAVEFKFERYGMTDGWLTQELDHVLAEQVGIQFAERRQRGYTYASPEPLELLIFDPGDVNGLCWVKIEPELHWVCQDARKIELEGGAA